MGELEPAGGSPTSRRPAAGSAGFVVARVSAGGVRFVGAAVDESPDGEGVYAPGPDSLLSGAQIADLLGIVPATWRSLVRSGHAPPADEPGVGPVNRRSPRWKVSTITEFRRTRPGSGNWRRTEASDGDQ